MHTFIKHTFIFFFTSNRFGETKRFDTLSGIQDIPAEGIKVWCEENEKKLYENIHFLLPKKNVVEEKISNAAKVRTNIIKEIINCHAAEYSYLFYSKN